MFIVNRGTPQGKTLTVGKYEGYLAEPPADKAHKDVAVLYLPDIIGVWQNSKLLVDEFAAAGYLTLMIDTFNGDPVGLRNAHDPEFDLPKWFKEGTHGGNPHTEPYVDPIVVTAIDYLKQTLGARKIGAAGYCFGAKVRSKHRFHTSSGLLTLEVSCSTLYKWY